MDRRHEIDGSSAILVSRDHSGRPGEETGGESFRFATSFGPARVYDSARQIPGEVWRDTFAGTSKDSRYYQLAAETLGVQFKHRYIALQNESEGEVVVQPVFLVEQDIMDGLPEKLHAAITWPRKLFPGWLKLRMLVVGCSAGDGALASTEPWAVQALHEALAIYGRKPKASVLLLKDFPSEFRGALQPFSQGDYLRVPSMPACALDLDFASFDEFMMKKLGKTFRESLRRKFKKLKQHPPVEMEVLVDATPVVDEITALYDATYMRSKMRFERLTREFFSRIGREMPGQTRFFIWRFKGKIAAFGLCLVHEGTMYNLNVGFDYSVALDLHLYFVVMRDFIQWALDHGLKRYVTGQLNYDPKLHFRMKLVPLDLYARHTSPWLNPVFKLALPFMQPARHNPVIRKFANFDEL